MDLNHDYIDHEAFLLVGAAERLQMCKCAILAFGDLGYTDPAIPNLRKYIGEYTDSDTAKALEAGIRAILEVGQLCTPEEIVSIDVKDKTGSEAFEVQLVFTFGTEVVDVPAVL